MSVYAVPCFGCSLVLGRQQRRQLLSVAVAPVRLPACCHPVPALAESSASWWRRARTRIRLDLTPLQSIAASTALSSPVIVGCRVQLVPCWGKTFSIALDCVGPRQEGGFNFQASDPGLYGFVLAERCWDTNRLWLGGFGQSSLWPSRGASLAFLPCGSTLMQSTSQQGFQQLPEEFGKEIGCLCTAQESQSVKPFSVLLQC